MIKIISIALSLFLPSIIIGQSISKEVIIEGKCRLGENVYVLAYTMTDYISMEHKELSRVKAEKGTYKLTFSLESVIQIFLQVGNSVGEMFAVPGNNYHVDIPALVSKEQMSFDRSPINLQIYDLPATDINLALQRFDSDYRLFIEDHYYDFAVGEYRGSVTYKSSLTEKGNTADISGSGDYKKGFSDMKMPLGDFNGWVELFEIYVDSNYVDFLSDPFFNDYKNYRIAELEIISGVRPELIYEENFFSKKVDYKQPAYFSLFKIVYGSIFSKVTETDTKEWIRMAINAERSPQSLELAFKNDSLYFNPEIRTLAMINALRENYNNTEFIKASIESVLENIATKDKRAEIAAVAKNLMAVLKKGKQGWNIENFVVVDHKKAKWDFSEHKGRYTYFVFFANWCSPCLKELMMLEKLQTDYAAYIDFVVINMDDSFSELEKYVKDHPDQKFTFLYGPEDPNIKHIFNLRALPTVMMVDPDGKIAYDYTRSPGEGIQREFDGIRARAAKKETTGPKTWKD